MAISTLSKIQVSLTMPTAAGVQMNVWTYNVLEIVGVPSAGNYAQAWWNHVKGAYRALAPSTWGVCFTTVRVSEMGNPEGEYGEYAIPAGEQTGTRTPPTDAEGAPIFLAAGVRLSVATRLTRPGQKRMGFLCEGDVSTNTVDSAYRTILNTLMLTMTTNMVLGAPAAGVVLVPAVVGLNADGSVRQSQVITGFAINPYVTSQVSRKLGRGI